MTAASPSFALPRGLDDVDAAFMTRVLRDRGLISATNEVVSQVESDVGMTAGYFSAIKKVKCRYREPTDVQDSFVVKTWPSLELLPKAVIGAMFLKDIKAYELPAEAFYPRVRIHLAASDPANDRWVMIMEDATTFAEHKVHESELQFDEVFRLLPRMADVAAAWEGCHEGEKARHLTDVRVNFWTSDTNLSLYKQIMPAGARFWDKIATMEGSGITGSPTWDRYLGGPDLCEMFTRKLDAFFDPARPENGGTCTLSHGDLRGDNLFFCDGRPDYPDGWLCIDFQLMFRGPVPSDLAYLMSSGSVLPNVYTGDNLQTILRTFYELFMSRTRLYKDYTYERFVHEYAMMTTVLFMYFVANGAVVVHQGAFHNALGARIELGGKGATEADLTPEERRQRMWWGKAFANFRENFKTFNHYQLLRTLPDGLEGLGPWVDLPDHLR